MKPNSSIFIFFGMIFGLLGVFLLYLFFPSSYDFIYFTFSCEGSPVGCEQSSNMNIIISHNLYEHLRRGDISFLAGELVSAQNSYMEAKEISIYMQSRYKELDSPVDDEYVADLNKIQLIIENRILLSEISLSVKEIREISSQRL